MTGAYGYCPRCGGLGISRERRLNGNDRCENGHGYPSLSAVANPLVSPETKRADSLALAYREQQGENDVLRAKLEATQRDCDAARAEAERLRMDSADIHHAYDFAREKATALERAAVVAWLRAWCDAPGHDDHFCAFCRERAHAANAIERGEHRREENE